MDYGDLWGTLYDIMVQFSTHRYHTHGNHDILMRFAERGNDTLCFLEEVFTKMSENWAERQRRTNQLVRIAADYVFNQKTVQQTVQPEHLYGLCKLTWITDGRNVDNLTYVKNAKIPALGLIFQKDFSDKTIVEVAEEISKILDQPDVNKLIISHTGFSNFYKVYSNSSLTWIESNFNELLPLFKKAFQLSNDNEGLELIRKISKLSGIPKPNNPNQKMHPEFLITPVFFALDSRILFPIINGSKGVKNLLKKLKVAGTSLENQYSEMIKLYGTGGIDDAADLDQIGNDITDFVGIAGRKPTKKLLESKPDTGGAELPLKDESDIISLQEARTIISKRLHNGLTNKLKSYLTNYTLIEGRDDRAMFDVLVKNYDKNKNDLLIEVKSSSEAAHIRMAMGQLYDYWFTIKGDIEPHLAILIPSKPDEDIIKLLEWLDIGILWFSGEELETCSDRLDTLIEN
ncbi:MAG: hypothetical protein NTW85_04400 [Methylococcales bacterium]|nr:hypothetical protein [Methylococcales bacterium]